MAAASLRMPKLGLTMTEAILSDWAVKVGDKVRAGDVLFTVETDKMATEIEATGEGEILSLDAAAGGTYSVGAALGTWTGPASAADDGDAAEPEPEQPEPVPVSIAPPASRNEGARIVATPLARRRAREAAITLDGVEGTGANGRIKARDIEAAIRGVEANFQAEPAHVPTAAEPPAIAAPTLSAAPDLFFVLSNADIGKLAALRDDLNAAGAGRIMIETAHMLIAAVSRAMIEIPDANAVWEGGAIVRYPDVDIAIVANGPDGSTTPVLRDAARSSLRNIVDRADALMQRAEDGSLTVEESRGGAIAFMAGGSSSASLLLPNLSPGRSSALGIGGVEQVFRPDADGQPVLRDELKLTLCCDARIWDGARATRFLDRIRDLIEEPLHLLL